jgi:RHS repeat-associated protein
MLASRFTDLVLGIDIHVEITPTGIPVPIPNPFIGMTMDMGALLVGQAMGYAQALATGTPPLGPVLINMRPATNVGTEAVGAPHLLIPPGVSWAPMPKLPKPSFKGPPDPPGLPVKPEDDGVHIAGSQTVTIMGSSAVRMSDMVLSCGEPVRLPTSKAVAIPLGGPVTIGGPPSISLMDAVGALVRSKWIAGPLHSLISRIPSNRLRNLLSKGVCFLTGHPVDVATGRVLTDALDFELPGALPLRFERNYSSAWANRAGPAGHGWSHSLDQAVWAERGKLVQLDAEGREIEFDTFDCPDHRLPEGSDVYEPTTRATLRAHPGGRFSITTADGIRREYAPLALRPDGLSELAARRARWARLVRERSRDGATVEYEYDDYGNLSRVTDSGGRHVLLEHDAQGRLVATHLPHPSDARFVCHTRYEYDDAGDLVAAVDALGQRFTYAYETHLLTRETNRNGLSFYFAYDGFGEDAHCVRTWGDGGIYDHLISYDKVGKATFVKNSLGFNTSYYMNAVGLVTKVIDPLGNTTQYEYHEPSLQRSKEVDPTGATTAWEYDARGDCTRITYPDGAEVRIEYDARQLPVSAIDALGGRWRWAYDTDGRLIGRSDPLGQSTQLEWDGPRLRGVTDALGSYTRLAYDAAGNLSELTAPDGTSTRWVSDNRGRCHTLIDPNGNQQRREHDLLGRVVRVLEPDGNERELAYDPESNVIRAKDRDHDVAFEYQGMSRLAARSEAGTRVVFRYDTEERLIAIENEHGAVYRFVLDPTGNVAEEHGFDGLRRRYQRDKAGRVALIFRPASATSRYAYDGAGRVTRVEHSDGTVEEYAYRADGELILAGNAATRVELERDPLGRITEERRGPHWLTSEYDALGRRTTIRSSKGLQQHIRRNALGDVLAIEASADGEVPRGPDLEPRSASPRSTGGASGSALGATENRDPFRVDFERDRLGLELERRLPGGVQSRWQRDALGRPQLHEIRLRGANHQTRQYTWATNDRLRALVDSVAGPIRFTHDALGNLAAATYADGRVDLRMPDAVGNLFRTADQTDRKYGPAGQLLEARGPRGTTHYEYDPEGNLARKLEPDGAEWRYRWSLTGTLTEVARPDGEVVTFAYDALGRRVSKTYRGKTTHWIWDGNVPLHEWVELTDEAIARDGEPLRTSFEREIAAAKRKAQLVRTPAHGPPELFYPAPSDTGLPAQRGSQPADIEPPLLEGTPEAPITWLFEPESFAPLAKLVADERYSIVTDHLGTPIGMFDGYGQEVWRASVDSYGRLEHVRGGRRACPFRFPGQYEDAETGLYYNRFRYYDPEAGGYVSQDPIGLAGGLRLHGYPSDPTTHFDPLGLAACKSWNEFQQRNKGKFKSRKDMASGWRVYKQSRDSAEELVIGRLEDTAAGAQLGMRRLNDPGWTIEVNDAWVQGGIDARKPFYLGTNPGGSNFFTPPGSAYPTTVFYREMQQLQGAGYIQRGSHMVPP